MLGRIILRVFPWLLVVVLALFLWISWSGFWQGEQRIVEEDHQVILRSIEPLGKIELVKYNFKDIFEYRDVGKGNIIIQLLTGQLADADVEVILIAEGEVVGCLDLKKITAADISSGSDTITVFLPAPEICYYKLNLENTRIYKLDYGNFWSKLLPENSTKRQEIIDNAYRKAESKIREQALESGILENTIENAELILKPWLESLTGKTIILQHKLDTTLPPAG
jgi:hypothetical protein